MRITRTRQMILPVLFALLLVRLQSAPAKPKTSQRTQAAVPAKRAPNTAPHSSARPAQVKASARSAGRSIQAHIAEFIYTVRPRLGHKTAQRLAQTFVGEARRHNISPYALVTTAYIESQFKPGLISRTQDYGLMQIHRRTYETTKAWRGLTLLKPSHNIRMGADYLARHYHRLASRGGERRRLAYAWGRYNGSGSAGYYARRALKVLPLIRDGNRTTWERRLRGGRALWE